MTRARKLARLEALERSSSDQIAKASASGFPGYVCGADLDDLQSRLAALSERGIVGRFTGYVGISPDDWDLPGEVLP